MICMCNKWSVYTVRPGSMPCSMRGIAGTGVVCIGGARSRVSGGSSVSRISSTSLTDNRATTRDDTGNYDDESATQSTGPTSPRYGGISGVSGPPASPAVIFGKAPTPPAPAATVLPLIPAAPSEPPVIGNTVPDELMRHPITASSRSFSSEEDMLDVLVPHAPDGLSVVLRPAIVPLP